MFTKANRILTDDPFNILEVERLHKKIEAMKREIIELKPYKYLHDYRLKVTLPHKFFFTKTVGLLEESKSDEKLRERMLVILEDTRNIITVKGE